MALSLICPLDMCMKNVYFVTKDFKYSLHCPNVLFMYRNIHNALIIMHYNNAINRLVRNLYNAT